MQWRNGNSDQPDVPHDDDEDNTHDSSDDTTTDSSNDTSHESLEDMEVPPPLVNDDIQDLDGSAAVHGNQGQYLFDDESVESTGVDTNTGVDENAESTGVDEPLEDELVRSVESDNDAGDNDEPIADRMTEHERFVEAESLGRASANVPDTRRGRRTRQSRRNAMLDDSFRYMSPRGGQHGPGGAAFQFLTSCLGQGDPEFIFNFLMSAEGDRICAFVTEQMSAKQGLKRFGQAGANAIMKELEQLMY